MPKRLYFGKIYGIIKVWKKYIDNICPPKPFRAIPKNQKVFFINIWKKSERKKGEKGEVTFSLRERKRSLFALPF